MLGVAFSLMLFGQSADPHMLDIGRKGLVEVKTGEVRDLRTNRVADLDAIAAAADGTRFVYVGESHDHPEHHSFQAQVIEALVKRGRNVIVGFEMFTRPVQSSLNPWTLGWWSEEEFIEKSEWKTQWGFPFPIYQPIFEVTKRHRLPMVALNVPRDWVRSVGREGYGALTAEQKAELPAQMDLGNGDHRAVFNALMGGHPPTGPRGENIYAAQVLWDEGMADTAIKYMDSLPASSRTVMVVIAGSGHVMYGQGINYRVAKRVGDPGITIVMTEGEASATVARGLGDFVYVAKALKREPAGSSGR